MKLHHRPHLIERRLWVPYRQAYLPRFWPLSVPLVSVVFTISWNTPLYVGLPIAIVLGYAVPRLRIKLWERRNPVLSVEEIARRSAPWN